VTGANRRRAGLAAWGLIAGLALTADPANTSYDLDRHPTHENVWLVGGGSGHGFKHGPAVGEYVTHLIATNIAPDARFSLATKGRVINRAIY